jgi:hypothetical protein
MQPRCHRPRPGKWTTRSLCGRCFVSQGGRLRLDPCSRLFLGVLHRPRRQWARIRLERVSVDSMCRPSAGRSMGSPLERSRLLAYFIDIPSEKIGDCFDRCAEYEPTLKIDDVHLRPGFTGFFPQGGGHDKTPLRRFRRRSAFGGTHSSSLRNTLPMGFRRQPQGQLRGGHGQVKLPRPPVSWSSRRRGINQAERCHFSH